MGFNHFKSDGNQNLWLMYPNAFYNVKLPPLWSLGLHGCILSSSIYIFQPSPVPSLPPTPVYSSPCGSFSRTFHAWLPWMCLSVHEVMVAVVLCICTSCERVSHYHFTKSSFKCLKKNTEFESQRLRKSVSGSAGTTAPVFGALLFGS